MAQRYSAMLLGPMVLIHLVVIILAVRNGLTADEILSRTRGNVGWFAFYLIFVLAATVHAPIGIKNILAEWTNLPERFVNGFCILFALLLLLTGVRAVIAVTVIAVT